MDPVLTQLMGLFLAIIAIGLIVAACAIVATWLALLVAGVAGLFVAVLLLYLSNAQAARRTSVRNVT